MAVVTIKQLLEAGVHFGHQTRRWNPKMSPYIYGERNGIHIIDLRQTFEQADQAYNIAKDIASKGGSVLFVGTKKQVAPSIAEAADSADQPYVNFRWLGGMLTNFSTIQKRIFYMKELARMEESGEVESRPKKERIKMHRELVKLERNLGGVRNMTRLPQAMFVIDVNIEHTAVKEATRLGIPVIALVDSNCDPDAIDIVIPGNDDAVRSAQLIAGVIAQACKDGKALVGKKEVAEMTKGDIEELTADEAAEAEVGTVEEAPAAEAPAAEATTEGK